MDKGFNLLDALKLEGFNFKLQFLLFDIFFFFLLF